MNTKCLFIRFSNVHRLVFADEQNAKQRCVRYITERRARSAFQGKHHKMQHKCAFLNLGPMLTGMNLCRK